MLHLLRRIRKNLLDDGNINKYFLYAVGEIFLVVIGILIALRINTWNENNKNSLAEYKSLVELKEEFVTNEETLLLHLEHKSKVAKEWDNLIKVTSGQVQAKPEESIFRKQSGTRTFTPSTNILDKLTFTGSIDKIQNDSLRSLLNSHNYILDEFVEEEKYHINFFLDHLIPYENELRPHLLIYIHDERLEAIPSPYHTSVEINRLNALAHKDFKYQNYILRNYYYIANAILSGRELLNRIETIISLLEKEIKSKQ